MRDDVLFTCWPPAPEERDARTSSSLRGITRSLLTTIPVSGGFWPAFSLGVTTDDNRPTGEHLK